MLCRRRHVLCDILPPEWGLVLPWIRLCSMGQDPTTVQVDLRVTRSLINLLVLLLPQNAPLGWALSERAIIPLPRGRTPPQQ